LGEQSSLDLRIGVAEDKLDNYTGDSAIVAAEVAQGALSTVSLGYTYEYDNRITGLNPKGGVLLRFGQDFAGIGGDTEYIETTALALAETKVMNEEVTLRAIFEGGAITSLGDNNTRVTDRFFGNGKIRGFEPNGIGPRDLAATDDDALGGNLFAVARFEADFPLGLPEEYGITGGAFMDIGSVWSLDNDGGGTVDDSFIPRATVGVSVFWTTPIGPLRFNFSHALKKEDYDREQTFDLTVSTRF
jgi:outer membrane protein insertion porin family